MTFLVRLSFLCTLCAALLGPTAHAQNVAANTQNIEAEVERLNDDIAQARSDNLHLSSPDAFSEASEYLKEAQEKIKEGDKISDIQDAVQRARKQLADARKFTDIGGVVLKDAFAARNAALEARAPEFAEDQWEDGEESLQSAGNEIEKGDQNDAREDAKEATTAYRNAELNAIQVNLLGTARTHRTKAQNADADEWAPQTWKTANQNLQKADQLLKTDRYDRTESRAFAEEATEQFKRARHLAEMAQRIDDDVEKNAEKVLLTYEDHISRIAKALGTTAPFGEGADAVTERLVATIQSQHDDRENLQASLEERDDRIDELQQTADSLDSRLATLEKRESTMSSELQTQRERERMLNRVREVFEPSEAEVLTSGEAVIVRMKGLNFASGSSEIQPKNFGLLTKLQQVIREFPGTVTISGHTDAEGNDALNMKLSEERSDAVHQYLTANMDIAPDRIRAVGRGESEPIATNETEEGRLKNRRIDVTIGFQE
jgi:outer membrane protein OmpA-like peptidoglycan-associated protein